MGEGKGAGVRTSAEIRFCQQRGGGAEPFIEHFSLSSMLSAEIILLILIITTASNSNNGGRTTKAQCHPRGEAIRKCRKHKF